HVAAFLLGPPRTGGLFRRALYFNGLMEASLLALATLTCLAVLLARTPNRRIALFLGGAFVLEEVAINAGAGSETGGRFAVVPIGLLTLMTIYAATAGKPGAPARVGAVLCIVVLGAGLLGFWTYRSS